MAEVEFELTFVPDAGNARHYTVEARSDVGHATAGLVLPDEQTLEERLAVVEEAIGMSSATTIMRSRPTVIERPARRFGEQLFNQVFRDDVGAHFRQMRERSRAGGFDLSVVIHAGIPALARIPWELMWDPVRRDYVALRCSVLRYSDANGTVDPPAVDAPLRLLVVAANPMDYPTLDVEGERVRLAEALGPLVDTGRVEVRWLEGDRWEDLRREMRGEDQWDVLHFIGHGGFDPVRQEGFLALVGPDTKAAPLLATELARLLETQARLRLVVLNACHSARPASDDQYASTAATLVRDGVPGVVAMQYAVSDEAASIFAMTLYRELAEGLPLAQAVTGGRLAITRHSAQTLEWATPVVYVRSVRAGALDLRRSGREPLSAPDEISVDQGAHDLDGVSTARTALAERRFEDVIELLSPLPDGADESAEGVRLLLAAADGLIEADNLVVAREALQRVIEYDPDNEKAPSLLTGVRDRLAAARETASRQLLEEKRSSAEQLVHRIEAALRPADWATVAHLVGAERASLGVSPEHLDAFLQQRLRLSLAGLIGRTRRGLLAQNSPTIDDIATLETSDRAVALSFFDNNGTLTAYFEDGEIRIWWLTARTLLQTGRLRMGTTTPGGQSLAVDGTGAWVSVMDGRGGVEVWDRLRAQPSIRITSSHPVSAIAPAMTGLLAGAAGETLTLWDVTSGAVVYAGYRHPGTIAALCITGTNAELAVTSCADGIVRVWSIPDDEVLVTYNVERPPRVLATDRYGKVAAYMSPSGIVSLLRISRSSRLSPAILAGTGAVALDLDAEGTLLVVACRDRTVRLFGTDDGKELAVIRGDVVPSAVRFGASGTFAVGWGEEMIKIYDVGGQI